MLNILLPLLLTTPPHQAIFSGFNLRWVKPSGQNGMVALSVGSAQLDGESFVYNAPPGVPASAYFPNDSPPITPTFPASITPVIGETYVAYCYIVSVPSGWAVGP